MSEISDRARALMAKHLALRDKGQPAFGADYFAEVEALERLLGHEPAVTEYGSPCDWDKYCHCTHQGCSKGFLNVPRPGKTAADNLSPHPAYEPTAGDDGCLYRCPTCMAAQRMRASDIEARDSVQGQPRRRKELTR